MPDLASFIRKSSWSTARRPATIASWRRRTTGRKGYNPLCGDHFTVYLDLEGDSIRDISFQGSGCAISKASASMMTQILKGKSRAEAGKLFDQFHKLVTGQCTGEREPSRPGQADRFFRRLQVSRAGQVRHAGLAHIARCARRETRSRYRRSST